MILWEDAILQLQIFLKGITHLIRQLRMPKVIRIIRIVKAIRFSNAIRKSRK